MVKKVIFSLDFTFQFQLAAKVLDLIFFYIILLIQLLNYRFLQVRLPVHFIVRTAGEK